jgi:hypothetical protein
MAFKAGDEVIVRETGWVGNIVKQRLDDDMYLVRFERFIGGPKLQLMSEADAELKASRPLDWWAPELTAERQHMNVLLEQDLKVNDGKLSEATRESMRKLGLIKSYKK